MRECSHRHATAPIRHGRLRRAGVVAATAVAVAVGMGTAAQAQGPYPPGKASRFSRTRP